MDYSSWSLIEAAQTELAKEFVTAIKRMDERVAQDRLGHILKGLSSDADFFQVAAHFNQLVGHKTAADYSG